MVGNDVVDLADVDADASTYSPRFDERVFTPAEREWLGSSADSSRGRWLLWAAKESAYKALKRSHADTVFSPSAFEVQWDAAADLAPAEFAPGERARCTGHVSGAGAAPGLDAGERLRVDVEADAERVHATAWRDGDLAPCFEVASLPGAAGDVSPSTFARRRLAQKLGAALGVPRARIGFDRRERVPIVLLDGRQAPIEVSLSHHGRFVACAWSLRGVRRARSLARVESRRNKEVCA